MNARIRTLLGAGTTVIVGVGGAFVGLQPAGASVGRNEIATLQYTVTVQGGYVHSYTVTPDACGPDFTGTGQYPAAPADPTYLESLSGTVGGPPADGVSLTYTDQYLNPTTGQPTGYKYTFNGAFTDTAGDFTGTLADSNLTVTGTIDGATSTDYNHGQFVSQNGPSAAHSCVGMPGQAHG